jgi:nitrogen fixation/metabolism regulation signal transduction histidine kinase
MPFAFRGCRARSVLLLVALLPVVALAANVCVWDYDSLDRWFDPAAGESVDCAYNVRQALVAQGHAVTVAEQYLPTDLSGFDVVFGLMGWFRC